MKRRLANFLEFKDNLQPRFNLQVQQLVGWAKWCNILLGSEKNLGVAQKGSGGMNDIDDRRLLAQAAGIFEVNPEAWRQGRIALDVANPARRNNAKGRNAGEVVAAQRMATDLIAGLSRQGVRTGWVGRSQENR